MDREAEVLTIPIVYGHTKTKILGAVVIAAEIALHHIASSYSIISSNILHGFDVSSVLALLWILFEDKFEGKYFYKLLVDGTMIIRFLLVFLLPVS